MLHRTLLIIATLLALAGCTGSSNPVLLDTSAGPDSGDEEDVASGDAGPAEDSLAPETEEEDVQLPCGCQSDAECLPAVPEACVEWRCIEGADGCGFCGQAPLDCNDGEACTEDSCDEATGDCVHDPLAEGEACDDGDLCTLADECSEDGVCTGLPKDCGDLNECTLDDCDAETGECVYVNVSVACEDGDACTEGDVCAAGACQPGPDVKDCDDDNPCTDDTCDPGTGGCVYTPSDAPGCCAVAADCDDDNPCTVDTCDADDGSCANVPVDDAPCDDGDACTLEDICVDGVCASAVDLDCGDMSECTMDSCDPGVGCVNAPVSDTTPCSDGDVCTQGDECLDGICVPGAPVSCDDNDACTMDHCVPAEGCVNQPVLDLDCCNSSADCDDGDPCTDDTCHANVCSHTPTGGPGCCVPECDGKECGPDGCGFFCGACEVGYCEDGICQTQCIPDCQAQCGPDGCGGSCGACDPGTTCGPFGACMTCLPLCEDATCGVDGCGGVCGTCLGGETCAADTGTCLTACACEGAACAGDGFEGAVPEADGTLAGWTWAGDVQVIKHLGATAAPEGEQMALVSTGLLIEENGAMWRGFCPPLGPTHLEFEWRFYSEEFLEWCGSNFQDSFEVSIIVGDEVVPVFSRTVSELCPPEECQGCGAEYVGLTEADVDFDVGGVYSTPWQEAMIPLGEGLSGGSGLTVRFEVSDIGDGIYDTGVLIDDVRLVVSAPCMSDQDCDDGAPCTQDACDPATGFCDHALIPGCCVGDDDCDDGNVCTANSCVENQCLYTWDGATQGCCQSDVDCDDGDPCTDDLCFFSQCLNTFNNGPGCCATEILLYEDFDDGEAQGWDLEGGGLPLGLGWTVGPTGHSAPNALLGMGFSMMPGMDVVAVSPLVSLPQADGATLSFWYQGLNPQNQCPAGALTISAGNVVLFSECQLVSDWIHVSLDISDFVPGDITLELQAGGANPLMPLTSYAVDDVVIETSCSSLPMP